MSLFNPLNILTDPDQLSATVKLTTETLAADAEVFIDTTTTPKTIGLAIQSAGTLSSDGVTLKALYSFLKDQWKTNNDLIKFPFPMTPITDEQFEFTNGWNLDKTVGGLGDSNTQSQTSPQLIRTGGWAVNAGPGTNDTERWASVVSLGSLEESDQVYYRQVDDITTDNTTDFVLTGPVNQAVQYYEDTNADGTPDFNYDGELTVYVRSWEKTYAQSKLSDIGVSSLNYQAYRFPLTNAADVKITGLSISESAASGADIALSNIVGNGTTTLTIEFSADPGFVVGDVIDITDTTAFNATNLTIATIGGVNNAITIEDGTLGAITDAETSGNVSGYLYNNMDITWNTTSETQTGFNTIAGQSIPTAYFKVTIDADVGDALGTKPTAEQIYAFVQASLRRAVNINTNSGTTGNKIGVVTPLKLNFVGDDLYTLGQSEDYEGVFISDYADADINRLHFWGYGSSVEASSSISTIARTSNTVSVQTSTSHGFTTGDYVTIADVSGGTTEFNGNFSITVTGLDTFTYAQTGDDESGTNSTGTAAPAEYTNVTYPFSATLTINFGDNLVQDADAIWKVFFTNDDAGSDTGRDFGTNDAIVVLDKDDVEMSGNVSSQTSVQRSYAYDTNQQRGNTEPVPAPITAVAIGLSTAQYVSATTTIERNNSNSVSLVAPLERNYDAGTA